MSSSSSPSPLVAVICSTAAQKHAVTRGFKSLAHLFHPFTTHESTIREPVELSQVSHRVRLDIRDISNDGHLLSLSVLPYVLIQALKSSSDTCQSIKQFREVLARWAEPSEHESFGAYLACIFVVSTQDEQPLGELSKMIQTQQTLYNSTSTLMIPPFCCSPKWATAHAKTPKHYILLHDSAAPRAPSTERRNELFGQMCATYGTENCQILQFDSQNESPEMSGVWAEMDELNDVLGRGLDEAFRHAADSTPATPAAANSSSLLQSPSSPSSVSTISSILPSVSSVSPTPSAQKSNASVVWKHTRKIFSLQDAKSLQSVLAKFLAVCLTPHVEKEMRSLYEAVGQKKGIGKSITTGMRKWFGTGNSSGNLAVPASYSWESPEMQTRRLADLLLMFGFFSSAHEQYLPLKRDLEADKAMVAYAMALEMGVVALHTAQPTLTAKQFPVRYLEPAISNLLEHAKRYPSILRCAFNISAILADLGCHKDAASVLSRLSAIEGDHLVAVGHTLAAEQFELARMLRKASFHRVLAANRFAHAGIHGLAFDCYRLALPSFDQKHWGVLDEHLATRLLSEGELAGLMSPKMAAECVRRLVAVCPKLTASQQEDRLRKVIHVLDAYSSHRTEPVSSELLVDVPRVEMDTVRVVYGERPAWRELDDAEHQSVSGDTWSHVERAAHYALFGSSTPYRGQQLVSDEHSDNQKTRETPANERFRVMVDLTNPLRVAICLRNVRLSVTDVHGAHGVAHGAGALDELLKLGSLEQLILEPQETKTVELYVFPLVGCVKFRVDALLYRLTSGEVGVETRRELECRGRRLNKTPKQQKSKVYATDERLSATVATKPWPLVEFRPLKSPPKWSYCDQAQRYQLEVENIGNEAIESMCLATNAFDRCSASSSSSSRSHSHNDNNDDDVSAREKSELELAANHSNIATFRFVSKCGEEPFLRVGEKKRLFFDIRSRDEPTSGTAAAVCGAPRAATAAAAIATSPTVVLIAYRTADGTMRQWRRVVDGERRRLISVHADVLDAEARSVAIHVRNCVAHSQAALSRVEVLRVRSARNEASSRRRDAPKSSPLQHIELLSPRRKIDIESEQSDTFIVSLSPSVLEKGAEPTWISSSSEKEEEGENTLSLAIRPPEWPCPAAAAEVNASMGDEHDEIRVAEKIGILWKASIVNNEGLVTSFIGESFIDDPFARQIAETKREKNGNASTSALQIWCETRRRDVSHDFSSSRMCELPVVVRIRNTDYRAVRVAVKCVPRVREPVDGVHLVAPESRHQMWPDRPVLRRRRPLARDDVVEFRLSWRVAHAAVYDVGGANLSVEAEFDGAAETIVYKVPSVLSVVKSSMQSVVV